MFRRLGLALTCLAVFSLLGGHWIALQSVAWIQMFGAFAKTESVGNAITKTFSGDYPCSLCKKVEEGRKKETSVPVYTSNKKIELFAAAASRLLHRPDWTVFHYPEFFPISVPGPRSAPPSPVPI